MGKRKTEKDIANLKPLELFVPQMGEGLREVKIIRFLKRPGDPIKEDEIIYEMETDKSIVEVESPYSGTLIEWRAEAGSTLEVGSLLGLVSSDSATNNSKTTVRHKEPAPPKEESSLKDSDLFRNISNVPPRTRAYCKTLGVSPEEMSAIPIAGKKLTPSDVDDYLKAKEREKVASAQTHKDIVLSPQQQLLIQRFKRSRQQIVPATLTSTINMDLLNKAARSLAGFAESDRKALFISEFQILAYAVAQISSTFPKFRSAFIQEYKIREYPHLNLGIAVQSQTGDLLTAAIDGADRLDFLAFIEEFQKKMELANDGVDQAKSAPHILLSYMGRSGIIFGAPVLVEPAVAILFFGTPYKQEGEFLANLSLTFDHRLINGMEAVAFLESINKFLTRFETKPAKLSSKEEVLGEKKRPQVMDEIQAWLLDTLSALLDIDAGKVDLGESLGLQGMDSIKAVELVKRLELYFGENFPATLLWHYPTYRELSRYLKERFQPKPSEPNESADELEEELKNLSPDELKRLLDKNFLE